MRKSVKRVLTGIVLVPVIVFLLIIALGLGVHYKENSKEEGNKQNLKCENMNFYYDDYEKSKYSIEFIKKCICKSQGMSKNMFGEMETSNLKIILHNSRSELQSNSKGLESVSGFYNTITHSVNLLIYNRNEMPEWEYEHSVLHEYGHYELDLFVKKNDIKMRNIPAWFNEGIAEYMAYDRGTVMYSPLSMKKIQSFRKMDNNMEFQKSRNEEYNPYMQSYYAIDSLMQMKGNDVICKILLETRNQEFYKAFESVTGMSIDDFEKQFMKKPMEEYDKMIKK